jgi:hypothetical protein
MSLLSTVLLILWTIVGPFVIIRWLQRNWENTPNWLNNIFVMVVLCGPFVWGIWIFLLILDKWESVGKQ